MKRNVVACEWLIFLGALCVGITAWPIAFRALSGHMELRLFYEALIGGEDRGLAWLFAAVPYAVIQLCRSIAWAIKNTRQAN